jgi:DNA-binding winged helix-turn-helix (wHTH) protein
MERLLTRQYLLDAVWCNNNPLGTDIMTRSLDTHISRVRKLLDLRSENGFRLVSLYGKGYRFEEIHPDVHGGLRVPEVLTDSTQHVGANNINSPTLQGAVARISRPDHRWLR